MLAGSWVLTGGCVLADGWTGAAVVSIVSSTILLQPALRGGAARVAQQPQVVVQSSDDLFDAQGPDEGGRQFDP